MFKLIWKIIVGILAIGLPVVIYLGFFAKEPVLDPEYDVLLGRQTVAGIGQDAEEYPILSRDSFPEVYSYLQNMVNELVESPSIQFKGMFKYDSLQIINLDYSREHEAEADKWSVTYLQDAGMACNGAAGFFEKLLAEGNDIAIPEFLNDHPDSKARVRDINSEAKNLACSIELSNQADWKIFQALLPSNSEILDSTKIGEDPNLQGK